MTQDVKFTAIIPARYHSTRLPGKVLVDIAGKPMIQHVYERALESGAEQVIIATDTPEVASVARAFGAEVCMTDVKHINGTERIAEVVQQYAMEEDAIVVNVQGDQPMLLPHLITQVAYDLAQHPSAHVSTPCMPITDISDMFTPHVAKVVFDAQGYALYFSRAAIAWDQQGFAALNPTDRYFTDAGQHFRHLGLYAYRAGFIKQYLNWPVCGLEQLESLEQLRILWHGGRIHVCQAKSVPQHEVNSPEDLQLVRQLMA
ncbi:MAG: 3-deoxy-manno-octulosonate cytidylyltransferase [Gammaproteobacteria bacterium]